MSNNLIRALVVDDSALYRKFVKSVLSEIPGVEVIGTASNGRVGLEKIKSLKPDLITLDQEMPELNGLGLLQKITDCNIQVATIMISSSTETGAKTTNAALQLGAFDFVLKPMGMMVDESRAQLKSDLAPKIEAFLSSRKSKVARARVGGNTKSAVAPRATINQMVQSISALQLKPKIIGIGVSTGGPAALNKLLPQLPGDFSCPIVLVQHMPPKFTKSLADDLNRICALEVLEAEAGMIAKAGQILIAPGGSHMRIGLVGGHPVVEITDDPPERSCKPSVDYLFRSLAHCYGAKSMGVVLTGMGDDGTLGCKLMKRNGARILIQDESTCVVYGMPRSVFDAGLADQVAPLDQIADCLLKAIGRGVTA